MTKSPHNNTDGLLAGLTDVQTRVIKVMEGASENDTPYRNFDHIRGAAGCTIDETRAACRHLRSYGLAQFATGLMTDEGEVYGSGYALTDEGVKLRRIVEERVYLSSRAKASS